MKKLLPLLLLMASLLLLAIDLRAGVVMLLFALVASLNGLEDE